MSLDLQTLATWATVLSFPLAIASLIVTIFTVLWPAPPTARNLRRGLQTITPYILVASLFFWIGTRAIFDVSPNISLTSHRSGDKVAHQIKVSGTYSKLPEATNIWFYIKTDKYYLLPATLDENTETWKIDIVTVGRVEDQNIGFPVGVITADNEANGIIRSKNDFALDYLPTGTKVYDTATLFRQ